MTQSKNIAVNIETCPYCMDCGGCDFIDTPYQNTLEIKKNSFANLLGLDPQRIEVVASPSPIHYRTRCQLQVSKGKLGFFKRKSHDLIEIQECLMLDERLNKKIQNMKLPVDMNTKIELYIQDGLVCERIVEKKYDNRFTQVNEAVNSLLVERAIEDLDPSNNDKVLELYCGLGNFSLPIIKKVPSIKLTGIDIRIKNHNIKGLEFIEADVEKGIKLLEDQKRLPHYNKLFLDPPRSGVKASVLSKLLKVGFERIVYVSCNPEALKNDAKEIIAAGYTLKRTSIFDMFPFSKYLESLNLFIK